MDNPKPTRRMIRAATMVLAMEALVKTIKPIVNGYHQEILDDMNPKIRYDDKVITDTRSDYEMEDDVFEVYLSKVHQKQKEHPEITDLVNKIRGQWKLSPIDFEKQTDYCPLLVAENMHRIAKRFLIETIEPITEILVETVIRSGTENYNKMVELTLNWLARYIDMDETK